MRIDAETQPSNCSRDARALNETMLLSERDYCIRDHSPQ